MRSHNLKKTILLFILFVLYPPQYIFAQQQNVGLDKKIKEVERAIEEGRKRSQNLKKRADSLKNDLSKAKHGRIAIAHSVQKLERKLSKLETEISDLNGAENEKRNLLESRRGQFTNILMALQRISRLPPEAIIAYPAGVNDLIRTAVLLRSAIPKIETQAAQLREDIVVLAATRELIANRKLQLDNTGHEFRKKRITLDQLIRRKAKQHQHAIRQRRKAASKIKSLSSKAKNLRDLFANLEQEKKLQSLKKSKRSQSQKPNIKENKKQSSSYKNNKVALLGSPFNLKPFALSRGSLRFPAVGRISGRYGETIRRGFTRKGVTLETRALAQVIAPHNGKVVFAGNFRGYGQLLIIDHGEGYHTLLAGMVRIDGTMGQYVLSGEPVGVMGTPKDGKPSLYIELRRNSQPINPIPWLAKNKDS
ncbi:MAG: peptidoglycan DD-metalloendopeptidase family protein [Pseudomonadota bacterium]|nr:peptidoglycan DD-metalloendopeptidase family protein [Pseudomonadota bacterium]